MKKIKFLAGGQPFRSTDFKVIQDNALVSIAEMLAASSLGNTVIVGGLVFDFAALHDPADPITVPAGYVFDQVELCRVPETSFTYDAAKSIYLRLTISETSSRTVGGIPQYVIEERMYTVIYTATPILGDVLLSSLTRLTPVTDVSYALNQSHGAIALQAGYAATLGTGMYAIANQHGDIMILCQFTATVAAGVVAILPTQHRPASTVIGWYKNVSSIVPLEIRANGEVAISGASTSGDNVIMFRFNKNVSYTL